MVGALDVREGELPSDSVLGSEVRRLLRRRIPVDESLESVVEDVLVVVSKDSLEWRRMCSPLLGGSGDAIFRDAKGHYAAAACMWWLLLLLVLLLAAIATFVSFRQGWDGDGADDYLLCEMLC